MAAFDASEEAQEGTLNDVVFVGRPEALPLEFSAGYAGQPPGVMLPDPLSRDPIAGAEMVDPLRYGAWRRHGGEPIGGSKYVDDECLIVDPFFVDCKRANFISAVLRVLRSGVFLDVGGGW